MGTPDFAVPCLDALINAGHNVVAVFTQPDKPKGRGYELTPPPVKARAIKHNIEVFQPSTMKSDEVYEIFKKINADVAVVVAYGKILPQRILDVCKYGCINVHASLLPKYRGAAPINWAVINGESESGVTTMQMDSGLDTGDMLLKAVTPIGTNDNAGQLHDRLSQMGAELIVETLEKIQKGEIISQKQGETTTDYARMLDKSMCLINWNDSAGKVHNLVRGLSPYPTAFTMVNGKKLKIYQTELCDKNGEAGQILSTEPLTIACGSGSVIIKELQLEGKKRMDSEVFLRGHSLKINSLIG